MIFDYDAGNIILVFFIVMQKKHCSRGRGSGGARDRQGARRRRRAWGDGAGRAAMAQGGEHEGSVFAKVREGGRTHARQRGCGGCARGGGVGAALS